MRLMLLLAPSLLFTAGCRAADDEFPPPSKPTEDPPSRMDPLIRSACEHAEGLSLTLPDPIRRYTRDDLYMYIDGAAERYLGYTFDHAAVAQALANEDTYIIELYHFGNSADAYGMWSTDAAGEDVGIGQGSVYAGGLLQFWRGAFFARIFHRRYLHSSREAVLGIGRALADAIGEDGTPPDLLAALPAEGLTGTPVFFHEQPVLNYLYYVSDANVLYLGPHTDAVFATYRQGEDKAKLLVVCYAGDEAIDARKAFVKDYLEAKPTSGPCIVKLENGLFTGIARPRDGMLRVVLDATSREVAERFCGPASGTGG